MKRHSWRKWKGVTERCARRYCAVQRRKTTSGYEYYLRSHGKGWTMTNPGCTGQPTTDK